MSSKPGAGQYALSGMALALVAALSTIRRARVIAYRLTRRTSQWKIDYDAWIAAWRAEHPLPHMSKQARWRIEHAAWLEMRRIEKAKKRRKARRAAIAGC